MSDPSEPRQPPGPPTQPPRPPTFTPPGHNPEYPPTSQFPPVSPAGPYPPASPAGPYPPQPPAYTPGVAQPPAYDQTGYDQTGYDQTAGWAQPPPYHPGTGYPPPGQGGPPGYPPGPQRPRKSAVPMLALVTAIALLLCGGVAVVGKILVDKATQKAEEIAEPILNPTLPALPTEGPGFPDLPNLPTGIPGLPGLPTDLPTGIPGLGEGAEISVTYEVTGDGPAEIVYVESGNAPKRVGSAKLPWKLTTKMNSPAAIYVVAVRAGLGSGGIQCRATVDGEQVAEHSAEGTLATANCYQLVVE